MDISDRQETQSCAYAAAEAPSAKRRSYSAGCQSAADAERTTRTATRTSSVTYENPVFDSSFPDPGVAGDSSTDYYAYGTGSGFPILKSADMVHWDQVGKALSSRPSWVVQSGDWHPWAPSVLRYPRACPGTASPGCYFLYYVGLSSQHMPPTECVAVAWSLTPSGPFTDLGPIQTTDGATDLTGRPPGCGDAGGYGNIDPASFVDSDGSVYLYVSTSRRCAQPTTTACPYEPVVSVLPMASTPTHAKARRKPLFGAGANTWEQEPGYDPQVENPWMEKRGSTYYLFYSGGYYRSHYGMGYATASSPTGGTAYSAFTKSPLNPILKETSAVLSPGGGSVTIGPNGGSWLVYHGRAGDYGQPRTLRIDPLNWSGRSVSTPGPTTGLQVVPPVSSGGLPPPPFSNPGSGPSTQVPPSLESLVTPALADLRGSLARGISTSVWCAARCTIESVVFISRRVARRLGIRTRGRYARVAQGTKQLRSGSASAVVRFGRRARRKLNRLQRVGLRIQTTLRRADGTSASYSRGLTLVRSPSLRSFLARGLRLSVGCSAACHTSAQLRLGSRTARRAGLHVDGPYAVIARGTVRLGEAGARGVVLRFTRAARGRLRSARRLSLRLVLDVTDGRGRTGKLSRRLTLAH